MSEVYSKSGEYLLGINRHEKEFLSQPMQFPLYTVLFFATGQGIYHADFGSFPFTGPVLLFSTPLQVIYVQQNPQHNFTMLQFHGDFYCIEYHRAEVSCNGLLFNNIYIHPCVHLDDHAATDFELVLSQLHHELSQKSPSEIVLRAYLQLFLAKSSNIKIKEIGNAGDNIEKDDQMEKFKILIEEHYLSLHKPSDYANLLSMSPQNLTRRSTRYFKKSASELIRERIILEAKKQLHLTRLSVKEIAYNLKFPDEFYFSRVFKKITKVSPQAFRDQTGISLVADLSKP